MRLLRDAHGRRPSEEKPPLTGCAGPEWHLLPRSVPAGITALLKRCLEEDPRQRRRDVGDVLVDLDEAAGRRTTSGPGARGAWREQPGLARAAWPCMRSTTLGLAAVAAAFRPDGGQGFVAPRDLRRELPVWRKLTFNEAWFTRLVLDRTDKHSLFRIVGRQAVPGVQHDHTEAGISRLGLAARGPAEVSRSGQLALALSCVYGLARVAATERSRARRC